MREKGSRRWNSGVLWDTGSANTWTIKGGMATEWATNHLCLQMIKLKTWDSCQLGTKWKKTKVGVAVPRCFCTCISCQEIMNNIWMLRLGLTPPWTGWFEGGQPASCHCVSSTQEMLDFKNMYRATDCFHCLQHNILSCASYLMQFCTEFCHLLHFNVE